MKYSYSFALTLALVAANAAQGVVLPPEHQRPNLDSLNIGQKPMEGKLQRIKGDFGDKIPTIMVIEGEGEGEDGGPVNREYEAFPTKLDGIIMHPLKQSKSEPHASDAKEAADPSATSTVATGSLEMMDLQNDDDDNTPTKDEIKMQSPDQRQNEQTEISGSDQKTFKPESQEKHETQITPEKQEVLESKEKQEAPEAPENKGIQVKQEKQEKNEKLEDDTVVENKKEAVHQPESGKKNGMTRIVYNKDFEPIAIIRGSKPEDFRLYFGHEVETSEFDKYMDSYRVPESAIPENPLPEAKLLAKDNNNQPATRKSRKDETKEAKATEKASKKSHDAKSQNKHKDDKHKEGKEKEENYKEDNRKEEGQIKKEESKDSEPKADIKKPEDDSTQSAETEKDKNAERKPLIEEKGEKESDKESDKKANAEVSDKENLQETGADVNEEEQSSKVGDADKTKSDEKKSSGKKKAAHTERIPHRHLHYHQSTKLTTKNKKTPKKNKMMPENASSGKPIEVSN